MDFISICPLFAEILSHWNLCRSSDSSEFTCQTSLLCPENTVFSHPPALDLVSLPAFCQILPKSLGMWGWENDVLCSHAEVSHSLYKLRIFVLIYIHCKKKRLWWGLSDTLMYRYNNKSLSVVPTLELELFLHRLAFTLFNCQFLLQSYQMILKQHIRLLRTQQPLAAYAWDKFLLIWMILMDTYLKNLPQKIYCN